MNTYARQCVDEGVELCNRIAEHKYSSIAKHLLEARGDKNLLNEGQFCVLKKFTGKLTALFTKCYSSKNWGLALKGHSQLAHMRIR